MSVDESLVDRTLVGRYRLERCIGRGGMASVYDARIVAGKRAGERAAVKVVHPDLTRDPMVIRRFQREAKAIERLSHPNVVEVYEHGVDGEQAFIAMELAAGTDLLQALAVQNPMPQGRATVIVAQVCKGLEAAHALGIVHRDLKPENVMLVAEQDGSETVKLLDFGIAKILETQKADGDVEGPPSYVTRTALTRVGTIVGTPAYMSPEQCRGGELDGRSDVYACGVLLYQIVTGELPFMGETPLHTAMRHLHAHAREPRLVRADLHPSLNAIILRALKKWPAERHQSARQLADELLAALPHLADVTPAQLARGRSVAETPSQPPPAHRISDRAPANIQLGQARLGQGAALAPTSAMLPSSTLDERAKPSQISSVADTPRAQSDQPSVATASTERKPLRQTERSAVAPNGGAPSMAHASTAAPSVVGSRVPSTPRRTPPRLPERSPRAGRDEGAKATVMTVPLRGSPSGRSDTAIAAATAHPRTLASGDASALATHPTETGLTPTTQFSPNEPRREDEDEAPTFVRPPPDEPERAAPAVRTWVMEPGPVGPSASQAPRPGPTHQPATATPSLMPSRQAPPSNPLRMQGQASPSHGPPPPALAPTQPANRDGGGPGSLGAAKTVEAAMAPEARRAIDVAFAEGMRPVPHNVAHNDAARHPSQSPPPMDPGMGAPAGSVPPLPVGGPPVGGHVPEHMRGLRATARMADEMIDLSAVAVPGATPSPPHLAPLGPPGPGAPPPAPPLPGFGDVSQIRPQPDGLGNRFADASGVRYPDGSFGPLKSTVRMAPEAATQLPGVDLTGTRSRPGSVARRKPQGKIDELPGSTALLIGVAIGLFLAVAVGLVVYVLVR